MGPQYEKFCKTSVGGDRFIGPNYHEMSLKDFKDWATHTTADIERRHANGTEWWNPKHRIIRTAAGNIFFETDLILCKKGSNKPVEGAQIDKIQNSTKNLDIVLDHPRKPADKPGETEPRPETSGPISDPKNKEDPTNTADPTYEKEPINAGPIGRNRSDEEADLLGYDLEEEKATEEMII